MIRHGEEHDDDARQHECHHEMINILPLIGISKPCRKPGSQLSDNHEEEIDDRLRHHLLRIYRIPCFLGSRLASRRDIPRSLYSETISDEHEEMRHQQRLTDKTHQQTAQSEYEQRVGLGTHETEDKENGEAHDTHHLLSPDAHQIIEERRESRHSYRGAEARKGDVFRLDAKPAHHLAAVGRINATHRNHRHEEDDHEDDAERFGHPIIKRIILIFFFHILLHFHLAVFYFLSALTTTIMPAARCSLSSLLRLLKSILTGTRC